MSSTPSLGDAAIMTPDLIALFRRLTAGVYVVGVGNRSRFDAFTAAAIMQVSYRPLLLALAINPRHASYELLRSGQAFSVSVLDHSQMDLARRFGTDADDAADKLSGIEWRHGQSGAPILAQALGFFDCSVRAESAAGDHRLFLGAVIDGALLRPAARPLVYADTGDLDRSAAIFPDNYESAARDAGRTR
jgi:flavin reductase (DIM6/NTAB) family NADH-FMN oxidoreductase RutF